MNATGPDLALPSGRTGLAPRTHAQQGLGLRLAVRDSPPPAELPPGVAVRERDLVAFDAALPGAGPLYVRTGGDEALAALDVPPGPLRFRIVGYNRGVAGRAVPHDEAYTVLITPARLPGAEERAVTSGFGRALISQQRALVDQLARGPYGQAGSR